jgi:hypothetical protein
MESDTPSAIGRKSILLPLLLVIVAGGLLLAGCATLEGYQARPVTATQIIKMSHSGVPAQDIIQLMRDSGSVYRLSASDLADLRAQGVPDAVIDYMQHTYLEAVRREQEREDWDYYMGYGPGWYGGWWY